MPANFPDYKEVQEYIRTVKNCLLSALGYVRAEDAEAARQVGIREIILNPSAIEEMGQTIYKLLKSASAQVRIKQDFLPQRTQRKNK